MAFTENVEKDDRHKHHKCAKPICTIARELRNRLQHGIVKVQPWAGWTNLRVAAPQKSRMELVQFGRGSPTSGDLGALFQHVEHLLEATDARKISLAEAHDRFGLDIGRQQDERLGTKVRHLYDRAQEGSRHLLESTLQLRWIEHALAKSQKTLGSQEE